MSSAMTHPSRCSPVGLAVRAKTAEVPSASFAQLAAASALVKMTTPKRKKKAASRPLTPEDKKKADRAKAFFVKLYGSRQMYGPSVRNTVKR
ncbi:hypothetical protein HDU78_010626 [Chytriomyces hyalinus]|nr:hypothetical protein HDU78_010626 [Chytriomyces hyalinus]